MHRSIAATAAAVFAAAAAAQPTAVVANLTVETDDGFETLGEIQLVGETLVNPGSSAVLSSLNPDFAPDIEVSVDVTTVGLERTVLITYSGLGGDPFVTDAAIDALPQESVNSFGIFFGVFFSDAEWDGGAVSRDSTLLGDGLVISDPPPFVSDVFFVPNFDGFSDGEFPPSQAGFFGGSTIPDTYTYEVIYTIVPAPAAAAGLGLAGLAALRRRR